MTRFSWRYMMNEDMERWESQGEGTHPIEYWARSYDIAQRRVELTGGTFIDLMLRTVEYLRRHPELEVYSVEVDTSSQVGVAWTLLMYPHESYYHTLVRDEERWAQDKMEESND